MYNTTTKVHAVFDALAKSATGISLNDHLLVGPTVHPPPRKLICYFIFVPTKLLSQWITMDISKMYQTIEVVEADSDHH